MTSTTVVYLQENWGIKVGPIGRANGMRLVGAEGDGLGEEAAALISERDLIGNRPCGMGQMKLLAVKRRFQVLRAADARARQLAHAALC